MTLNNDHASVQFDVVELHADGTEKYSAAWWKDTADRVVSTTAQTALATLTAAAIPGLLDVDPIALLSVSTLGGALAFLKALAVTRAR